MAFGFRKFLEGLRIVPKTSSTASEKGDMEVIDGSGKLNFHNGSSVSPIVTEAHASTLTNKSIDADANTITNIDNADIKAGAAIDRSKLASGTADHVLINNGSGVASSEAQLAASRGGTGADLSAATGTVKVAAGVVSASAIVNADIDAAAAIARSKLASGTADHVLINNGSGVASSEAQLAKVRGGTGADNSSVTFPASGTIVTEAGTQALTNKDVDGGTASNSRRITLPKDTLTNLNSLTRKEGTLVYSTDQAKVYFDNGTTLTQIGSGGGGGISWNETTGTSQTLAVNNGYIANNASRITFTLPATSAVGDSIALVGKGAGGWKIAQGSGQKIYDVSVETVTGTSGGLISGHQRSCFEMICLIANTTWTIRNKNGFINSLANGYVAGGRTSGGTTYIGDIFKFDFGTETGANIAATLNQVRSWSAGASSSNKGYIAGGAYSGPTNADLVDDIDYSADTSTQLSAVLSAARRDIMSSQSTTKGYFAGGLQYPTEYTLIEALTFSGESVSTLGIVLAESREAGSSITDRNNNNGYFMGGTGAGLTVKNTIYKIDMTAGSEAMSTLGATLDSASAYMGSIYSSTKGYICGGNNAISSDYNKIEDLDFSTELSVTISETLTAASSYQASLSGFLDAGYLLGGSEDLGSTEQSYIRKFVFSTETESTISETLDTATVGGTGVNT